jgi:hypothetical protein
MANRLKNAPSSAARLSGKEIGSIDSEGAEDQIAKICQSEPSHFFQSGMSDA